MCERPSKVRRLTRHHIVPKVDGGSWVNNNIVPLCRLCHDLIDCHKRSDRRRWRRMLRHRLRPGELRYARNKMGQAWLDGEYPVR